MCSTTNGGRVLLFYTPSIHPQQWMRKVHLANRETPDLGQGSEAVHVCVTWMKCILSISFLKISPVPPVTLPPTHQTHAPAIRRLPVIDLNLRGNYFPRDLFVLFFFFIFLSDTRGYRSERRRRDWCKTRVWPFTEARRRWSGSRVSDNSSFLPPPLKRVARPLSGIRLASIHTPEVISSWGGRGRTSLSIPSPALRCRLQEKRPQTDQITLCFLMCEDRTLSARTVFETVTHWSLQGADR